jgi:hypothetical protein
VFEKVVSELATSAGLVVKFCVPPEGDRSTVFRRDYEMVDAADYVEAYFPADHIMEGGTGHVVEAAINREKPVYAWSVSRDGSVGRIGEIDRPSIDGRPPVRRMDR